MRGPAGKLFFEGRAVPTRQKVRAGAAEAAPKPPWAKEPLANNKRHTRRSRPGGWALREAPDIPLPSSLGFSALGCLPLARSCAGPFSPCPVAFFFGARFRPGPGALTGRRSVPASGSFVGIALFALVVGGGAGLFPGGLVVLVLVGPTAFFRCGLARLF